LALDKEGKDMSKIASAGLLSDIDCAQIINAVTKMINFDDAIF
jgi:hypothetical protein